MADGQNRLDAFLWGSGGRKMTPGQVDRERLLAQSMIGQASDTSPVGHWTAALTRGLQGWFGGRQANQARMAEDAGLAGAEARMAAILGGGPNVYASSMGGSPISAALGGHPSMSMGQDASQPLYAGEMAPGGLSMGAQVNTSSPEYIRQGLIDRGLPAHVADGFMMNFQDESGMNPGINEVSPLVPGSRGGFGLYQLTGGRRTGYESFAANRGVDPSNVDAQLDWLMYELGGPEAAAARSIFGTSDAGQAGAAIVNDFLRPEKGYRATRAARYAGGGGNVASALMGGGPSTMDLASLASDPWVAQEYGGVINALMGQAGQRENAIFQQQLAQQDPMYQAQLAQLMAPKPTDPWAGVQVINDIPYVMGANGVEIAPGFTPQPALGYSMLTPQQAADMGLPAGQAYQQGADGKISQIGGNGTTVNVGAGETEYDKARGKSDAEIISGAETSGLAAQRTLAQIGQLETAISNAPSGMSGRFAQLAGEWGLPVEGASDVQAAQAIINALVPAQRPPGSGPMSDADLELFKQSLPRIINTPEGNAMIIRTMRGLAEYDAMGAEIAGRERSGAITREQAIAELRARPDPFAAFKGGSSAPAPGPKRLRFDPATGKFQQ